MQYSTSTTDRDSFVKFHLPLILLLVALIGFNLLLYARLTSDNPRPDLVAGAEQSAQTAVVENLPVENGLALMPANGALGESGWKVVLGDWIAEENGLRQTGLTEFDQSIVYTPRTFETFAYDVTLRHVENIGGGILFNLQGTDGLTGGQLVRFEVDGSALFWGSFDTAGNFTGQGFVPIAVNPFQSQRLSVRSHATTYDILLNDSVVARDIPLIWQSGYVGLAASQSEVLFEQVDIRPIGGVGTAEAVEEDLLSQSVSISGEWVQEDGVIRQLQNEATDYMTALNVLGRTYTLEATVNMALEGTPEDSGAGFIFHMRDRDDRVGATMLRLIDQGERLVWGTYDQAGVFQGAGNLELELESAEMVKLAVRLNPNSYDILVNDEVEISGLPLTAEEGWVGLVAYRGAVEFSDVRLNIGE